MMLGRIAQYELTERIGHGGMGVVFKAHDSRLDRVVAIKILPDELARDAEYRARFLREARAEASLSHAHIATCFDVGEARLDPPDLLHPGEPGPPPGRVLYLTMEYVPGTDLSALVGDRPMEMRCVIDLTLQIAEGLECAHASGLVHRDLKPTNVRVTPEGLAKILDFGLSRRWDMLSPRDGETQPFITSEGRVMGTVHYMAPEQAQGRTADPRSDLFSLGVILYELVTGKLPFSGDTPLQVLYAVTNEAQPPLERYASLVPPELERIVRKLLVKDPSHRYQSAHEVRTDLEQLRKDLVAPRLRLRYPARHTLVVAGVVVAVAFGGWWAWPRWGPRPVRSLAVLPFENHTGDPRLDYLCEGMAAGVLNDLVRNARFNVASLSSTRGIEPKQRSFDAVTHELGVESVLAGALRRQSGVAYLDVELTGNRGFVLWSERYPHAMNNVLGIESEIVRQVASVLTGRTIAPPGLHAQPRSASAYDFYLRATPHMEDADDPQGPDQALELYAKALELDPDFALAWAGKSAALWKIWNRDRNEESLRLSEEAANYAIRLNPALLEARVARAQIYRGTSRYAESIKELRDVLSINPNWDEAELQLAASYRDAGDLADAEKSLRQAVALRPNYWRNWNALGSLLVRRGDYDGARAAFRQIVRLVPEKNRGFEQLAAVEILRGDYAGAIAEYQKLPIPVQDGVLASNIASAYFFLRRIGEAKRFYVLAATLEPRNPSFRQNLGDLYVRAGEPDSARYQYAEAVRLLEDLLHVDPHNVMVQLDRATCLAKRGECAQALDALHRVAASLPANDAECAHLVAKLQALCGRRAEAVAAVRRAVDLGISASLIRDEDEFVALAGDPMFKSIARRK